MSTIRRRFRPLLPLVAAFACASAIPLTAASAPARHAGHGGGARHVAQKRVAQQHVAAAPKPSATTGAPVDVSAILTHYRTSLGAYHTPQTMSYIYTIDQAGQRQVSQTHLIYRDKLMVRDETIAIGSSSIKPHIHIYRSRAHHYSIEAIAPRLNAYHFRYLGENQDGSRITYHFATTPIGAPGDFLVTELEIDGTRFLPTTINFRARSAASQGDGVLHYEETDGAWLIREASASGRIAHGTLREHLVFRDVHVLANLPAATFGISEP